ncbi:MAG TPA: hypothetical protein VFL41_00575 [Gaiellaceae bacterium]|nr:hypothetical protein [Gaiellaceae bacterium]
MSCRAFFAVALLASLAGCGGGESRPEVRLLAPAWIDDDVARFERDSGCRVDLRTYDEGDRLEPIAERRDVDVIAAPTRGTGDQTEAFVRVKLSGGVEVTVPERLASGFRGPRTPAGRRSIVWRLRPEGDNDECARRWLAYASSQ